MRRNYGEFSNPPIERIRSLVQYPLASRLTLTKALAERQREPRSWDKIGRAYSAYSM